MKHSFASKWTSQIGSNLIPRFMWNSLFIPGMLHWWQLTSQKAPGQCVCSSLHFMQSLNFIEWERANKKRLDLLSDHCDLEYWWRCFADIGSPCLSFSFCLSPPPPSLSCTHNLKVGFRDRKSLSLSIPSFQFYTECWAVHCYTLATRC